MKPLSFDDEMLDRLTAAAALLPENSRSGFLRSVANLINHLPEPGMADLETTILFVLNTRGVGGRRAAFYTNKSDRVAVRARADRCF